MRKASQPLQRLIAERGKLGVAHTPTTLKLLNHKLAIEKQINFSRAKLGSEVNRRHYGTPLCNVICGGADRRRD